MTLRQKKLAIIGASAFQVPLIVKAKELGVETHVFAWASGDVGEAIADYFYPISITEKDDILRHCQEINVDGVATIGSDLANVTVAYVAEKMGFVSNSVECVYKSTNKHAMRRCFEENGDPSPKSIKVASVASELPEELSYPVIVKPADRSGSRGITRVNSAEELQMAIAGALNVSFSKEVLVEEYFEGKEYSVEYLSWEGKHYFLALTEKFTTGAPNFIETGHLQPARVPVGVEEKVKRIAEAALTHLGVAYGASHTEIKINQNGEIALIEIGSRMGGDCIGSHLVQLSTGIDFVGAVAEIALGKKPGVIEKLELLAGQDVSFAEIARKGAAGIRFVFSSEDINVLNTIKKENPECLVLENIEGDTSKAITDSSTRYGFYIFSSNKLEDIECYLPSHDREFGEEE